MKNLRLWAFTFLSVLPYLITIEGYADSNRPSINTNGMVRLVYFVPSDRRPRSDQAIALRELIKEAHRFYADQMDKHGFGRRTFNFEFDEHGDPIVHQIRGKFTEHYYNFSDKDDPDSLIWKEIVAYFDNLHHVYFVAMDSSRNTIGEDAGGLGGPSFFTRNSHSFGFVPFDSSGGFALRVRNITQGEQVIGGLAIIPAFNIGFHQLSITLHELEHAFALEHDFRKGRYSDYVMGFGHNRLSKCAAEWLSVHRFFNTKPMFRNESGEIEFLSIRTYNRDVISFRFRVTDPDGLHQTQLLVPTIYEGTGTGAYRLFDCKQLNGKTGTIESVVRTSEIVDRITLQIIDIGGNITWATFPIRLDETEPAQNALDVNRDGTVDILDLVFFVSRFGQRGQDPADVNENGVIDIVDVLLVAAHIPALSQQAVEMFTEANVQQWLTHAKQLEVENEILKKGIVELERLLAVLTGVSVDLPDAHLRAAVETALRVAPGTPIVSLEMTTLTELRAPNANISDLTGLEFATNLTMLNLGHVHVGAERRPINSNSISNISPLAGLTNLTELWLGFNLIADISVLSGLTNLTFLDITGNMLSDISPVAGLTNLTSLDLDRNAILDISAVAGLTNLTFLDIWGTPISDISPVAGLINLTVLGLGYNSISDLSPLIANTGLGEGDEVYVQENPLSYQSIHTHIPILRSRGVTVGSDNRPHPALLKVSGDSQKGAAFASLSQPFVVEAQDENGFALVGVSVAFAVTGGSGTLSIKNTITDENGRAQSTLTLGPNLGTNTVEVSAAGIKSPVTFYAISDTEVSPITADVNNDGSVNVLDLVVIASELGNQGQNLTADVNGDGIVSILDLVLAASMFEDATAAPAAQPQVHETLTAVEVQGWLTDARALEVRDPITKRGFLVLEQLLVSLTPKETELLANYPNPFNPETWIPYRLAEDAFVTLTIYDGSGRVVRTLEVGHRIASAYESRSKAIHWDGRNDVGEQVASGVYFYTVTAGDYSATRKMLILK